MWIFGRRKHKEQEECGKIEQRFQELRETLNQGFGHLADRHDKAEMATENIRVALENDTNWKPVPANGFYRQSPESELHGGIFLPITPEYDLTLRVVNRTYRMESIVNLVVSRKYMHTRKHTQEDGHEVLIVSVERDLAPRSFIAALRILLEPEEAGVWLDVQEIYRDESNLDRNTQQRVAIIAYPFLRDLSFKTRENAREVGSELYFDCEQPFCNILNYPLTALTPISGGEGLE